MHDPFESITSTTHFKKNTIHAWYAACLKTYPFSLPSETFNSSSLKICYAYADATNFLNLNIKCKDSCHNFESAKLTS